MTTHYAVLELSDQVTPAEIRRAYRRLVQLTHPDRTPDPAQHRRYLAINEAYETLSDSSRRAAYDASLRPAAPTVAAPAAEPHPDPAMRRRGFQRARPVPRPPLAPLHIRYAAEFQRALPRFRVVAWLSLLFALLLGIDFYRSETLPAETVQEFEYVVHRSRRGSWSYFIVHTQHTKFTVSNTTELEEGDHMQVNQTPWFGRVKTVLINSGKMQGSKLWITDFAFVWPWIGVVAFTSLLLLLRPRLRPDRAYTLGFSNSVAVFFLVLFLYFL